MSALEEHDGIQLAIARKFQSARKISPSRYRVLYDLENKYSHLREEKIIPYGGYIEVPEWLRSAAEIPESIDERAYQVILEMPVPGRYEPVGYLDIFLRPISYQVNVWHEDNLHRMQEGGDFCFESEHWGHTIEKKLSSKPAAVEVKSYIKSAGELFRQVQRYRSALPWCNCPYRYGSRDHLNDSETHYDPIFWVVSPDDRFADVIESQGLIFKKFSAFQDAEDVG